MIYDLRRDDEREQDPGPRACFHLPLPSGRVGDTDPLALREREDGEKWLLELYLAVLREAGSSGNCSLD